MSASRSGTLQKQNMAALSRRGRDGVAESTVRVGICFNLLVNFGPRASAASGTVRVPGGGGGRGGRLATRGKASAQLDSEWT